MPQTHRAFTLVEVLVAVVLVTVALVALEAGTARTIHRLARATIEERGAALAARRTALAASRCATGAGVDSAPGIVSRWTVTGSAEALTVTRVVAAALPGLLATRSFTTVLRCP